MEHSVNPYDLAIWATIALVVQLVVYAATRLILPDVGRDIPAPVGRCPPGAVQNLKLATHVRELRRIGHPRGLDPQDRDLVEDFAGRYRHEDF